MNDDQLVPDSAAPGRAASPRRPEPLDPSVLMRYVRKGWALVLAGTVLGILGAILINTTETPLYRATTSLYVSVRDATTSSELAQGGNAAEQKVQSFASVAKGSRVLRPVIEELDLHTSPTALARRVSTETPIDSVLINITATDEEPARAAAIADAVGRSLARVVTRDLEKPSVGESSPFRIEPVQDAITPTEPASPRVMSNTALGIALGLLAGGALAALRITFDNRLEGRDDVSAVSKTPVVGEVPYDRALRDDPLVVSRHATSPRAEVFRRLRANLRFLEVGRASKSFVITSSVPGEGKSTTAVNTAIALAEDGLRVALVDGDLRRPRIAELMGIEGAAGLTDVLIGRLELDTALQPWGRRGLVVLPAGALPPNPAELLSSAGMGEILTELESAVDVVVIDAPPLLPVSDAIVLGRIAGGVLLVAAMRRTTRRQLTDAAAALRDAGLRAHGVIMTMVRTTARDPYTLAYSYASTQDGADDPDRDDDARGRRQGAHVQDPEHAR